VGGQKILLISTHHGKHQGHDFTRTFVRGWSRHRPPKASPTYEIFYSFFGIIFQFYFFY